MKTFSKTPPPSTPDPSLDDPTIPVLTDRLGLPPLDFDTTLPMIDSLIGVTQQPVPDEPAPPPPPVAVPPAPPPERGPATVLPAAEAPVTAIPAPPPVPRPPVEVLGARAVTPSAALPAPGDGQHWSRIEADLRTSILRDIAAQLPRDVESIVRRQMDTALERLIGHLATETKLAVAAAMREIVEHAVRAEIERLRNSHR
jgi:hypothetical protein